MTKLPYIPMRRNLAQPLDARILERRGGIQPLGDGVADEGDALLAQEGVELLRPGDEGVDLGGLAVEVGGDGALLGEGWDVCEDKSLYKDLC